MDEKLKKGIAVIGTLLTITHLTYYFIAPYSFVLFFLGFGVLYVVFVKILLKL